mgnify:FL=1
MRIDPSGAELLDLARTAVLEELLPLLPASAHYTARMVCNAMAIAQRQLQGQSPASAGTDGQAFIHAIEAGELDGQHPQAAAGRDALWRLTCEQLAESDPKALPG